VHYTRLFDPGSRDHARAAALAAKTCELFDFLVNVARFEGIAASFPHTATYHDSCSGLRELGVKEQPRRLLAKVHGLELREMEEAEICCGFGGTFCVKYPALSERIVDDKIAAIERTGAEYVLGGDLGCLMNIAGRLKRRGSSVKVLHAAEVLAGAGDSTPVIGEPENNE
jgi:L-lactate dehydrogenase complex protein LldE